MASLSGSSLLLVAPAILAISGCSGCKRSPVLRLTYEVDVAAAYDGERNIQKVMETSRDVIAYRLSSASVATRGQDLIVDLPSLPADQVNAAKSIITQSGRLEFKLVDDHESGSIFGPLAGGTALDEQGIEIHQEQAADGLDATGAKRFGAAFYARISCRPKTYASESLDSCLARFKTWTSTLRAPDDHQIAFQAVTGAVNDGGSQPLGQSGWRTVYVRKHAELTQDSIDDVGLGQSQEESGQYYALLSLSPAGGTRFEEVTANNVNRRFAIVIDDIVNSAPVIKQKIGGGRVTITMGAGDAEKQRRDANWIALVVKSRALPAPLRLLREESPHVDAR